MIEKPKEPPSRPLPCPQRSAATISRVPRPPQLKTDADAFAALLPSSTITEQRLQNVSGNTHKRCAPLGCAAT